MNKRTNNLIIIFVVLVIFALAGYILLKDNYINFKSNKLDYIGEFLGLGRKNKTSFDLSKKKFIRLTENFEFQFFVRNLILFVNL